MIDKGPLMSVGECLDRLKGGPCLAGGPVNLVALRRAGEGCIHPAAAVIEHAAQEIESLRNEKNHWFALAAAYKYRLDEIAMLCDRHLDGRKGVRAREFGETVLELAREPKP